MKDELPAAVVERIDEVCDRFEAAWKAGQQPRIQDYLDSEAGPDREALLRELQRVDAHYRRTFVGPNSSGAAASPRREQPCIAGYEVLRELGRGGMGVVYLARQLRPSRLVALKTISAGAHAGARELERFRREADAVAQLQHPHIVQVFEVGEENGQAFFAMEYVAGGSLDQQLRGAPQPPRDAAMMVERLADAIQHAHERGIIHRDLKPANVLLQRTEDGRQKTEMGGSAGLSSGLCPLSSCSPKITDFGLAKLLGSAGGHPTQTGDLLGTPGYMAPEQVAGNTAQIGPATDVYGLGAILYEVLTGRPPFRGETALETMLQVQTAEPVSPSRLQPKCPRDLVTICLKCLRKQPRDRYVSARELAEDLRRFQDGLPIRARPIGPIRQFAKWTRRQPIVAGLAAMLLAAVALGIGVGIWYWWQAEMGWKSAADALGNERVARAGEAATLDRYRVALAHREWLANNAGRAAELLNSCTAEKRDSWEWRYLDRLRNSAIRTFPGHTNTVEAVAVSPSGRHVASVSHDRSVRIWDLETGQGKRLGTHRSLIIALAYSPVGKHIASGDSRHGTIKLWDGESGAALEPIVFAEGEVAVWGLSFHPSGRYLAAVGQGRLKVWDIEERRWACDHHPNSGQFFRVAFSPDGHSIATAGREVKLWEWADREVKLRHQWPAQSFRYHDIAFNADGSLLAGGRGDGLIQVFAVQDGKDEYTLNAHPLAVTSVAFGSDGLRLFSAGQEGDMHVWDVKHRRRLFSLHGHSGAVWDLAYTPNGSRLISGGSDFLVRVWNAADGQEAVVLPCRFGGEARAIAYGPGSRLLAWGDINGSGGVWDTVLRQQVHQFRIGETITAFAFSPDARQLAVRLRGGRVQLWDVEQWKQVPLPDSDSTSVLGMVFAGDSSQLLGAFWKNGKLSVRELQTGREWYSQTCNRVSRVVWCPDASRFATVEEGHVLRVRATEDGRPIAEFDSPSVGLITFSRDGRVLATGRLGGRIRVWDLLTKREIMAVTGHPSNIYGLALSPDGRRLASAASDCTVKLWDVWTGQEMLTLRNQLHEHSVLAFSPDGTDIVSVNSDNQLQVWSTRDARMSPRSAN